MSDSSDLAFPYDGSEWGEKGMTLRDYFAAKAMQGYCAALPERATMDMPISWANDAYEMADAMLEAREK